MADEKNPMDFEEPTDGGMSPAESEDIDEIEEEELEEEDGEVESDEPEVVANLPLDVIEEAVGYGLKSEEIQALGSEENIAAVLAILDRQMDTVKADVSDSAFNDEDDPFAEPDENTGGSNSEVAELRKQVESMRRALENRVDDSNSEKLFGILPDGYDDLFGGVGDDLTKTQQRNRSKVLQELDTVKAGYKARKRAIPSDRRLFKQAVRSVFGEHETKVVKKKFSESAKKRKSQFINRVNARDTGRPKDGRASAVDSVKKFLADRGYTDLESVETFE
tara:strand:+ start:5706 stop:6539 length:834 start_codon:yes stop_codon:yes gene_type:complete